MPITEKEKTKFLDLYCMVMADGNAHPEEMKTLYQIGTEAYGFTLDEMNEAIKNSGTYTAIPEEPEEKIALLYQLAIIAWADGELEESERQLLKRYAKKYGVRDEEIDELTDFLLDKAEHHVSENDVINELKS